MTIHLIWAGFRLKVCVNKNNHLPVEFWGDCFETDSNSLGCLSPTVTSETAVPICIWGLSAPNGGLKTNCTISEPVGISLPVYFDEAGNVCLSGVAVAQIPAGRNKDCDHAELYSL